METQHYIALRKPDPKYPGTFLWLIVSGWATGKWTSNFGVPCLADLHDNKEIVRNTHKDTLGTEIVSFQLALVENT